MVNIIVFILIIGYRYAFIKTVHDRIAAIVARYTSADAVYARKCSICGRLKKRDLRLRDAEREDLDFNIIAVCKCMLMLSFSNTVFNLYFMWEVLFAFFSLFLGFCAIYGCKGLSPIEYIDFVGIILVMGGIWGTLPFLILIVEAMRKLRQIMYETRSGRMWNDEIAGMD